MEILISIFWIYFMEAFRNTTMNMLLDNKAPARSEKIQQKRGEERACVFVGFSNEGRGLSKPNQGFPNRGGQKMGQKSKNLRQLSTAHFSGVLEAF